MMDVGSSTTYQISLFSIELVSKSKVKKKDYKMEPFCD